MFVSTTPQVLTFAALTKNFDIQSEVEARDDLDNKPDNEEIENLINDDFAALFAQLLIEIKSNVGSGREIFLPLQTDFYVDATFTKSPNSGGGGLGSNIADQNLNLLIENAINQKFKPKAFELADFDSKKSKNIAVKVESNSNDFSLKTSFSKADADRFAEFLNQQFSLTALSIKNNLIRQIYENTHATAENNQVFIITRLPRGSLDALLAKN